MPGNLIDLPPNGIHMSLPMMTASLPPGSSVRNRSGATKSTLIFRLPGPVTSQWNDVTAKNVLAIFATSARGSADALSGVRRNETAAAADRNLRNIATSREMN